jgi:hypothetical protein
VLADGSGQTLLQKGVESIFLLAGFALAWTAVALRARDVCVSGHSGTAGKAAGFSAVAVLALAFVIPSWLGSKPASVRPTTDARIEILAPGPGQVLVGDPATVHVRLRLERATIVTYTSTHLVPDKGHIHLYVDDSLVLMAYGTSEAIDVPPGTHVLTAEFVAVDHGPFNPPVTASVRFRVVRS